jgi:hypothetical protein
MYFLSHHLWQIFIVGRLCVQDQNNVPVLLHAIPFCGNGLSIPIKTKNTWWTETKISRHFCHYSSWIEEECWVCLSGCRSVCKMLWPVLKSENKCIVWALMWCKTSSNTSFRLWVRAISHYAFSLKSPLLTAWIPCRGWYPSSTYSGNCAYHWFSTKASQ